LAALLASNKEVELVAALYDEEQRKPLYSFLQGTIGKSYAFETASRYIFLIVLLKKQKKFITMIAINLMTSYTKVASLNLNIDKNRKT